MKIEKTLKTSGSFVYRYPFDLEVNVFNFY
jgi:hypothetical protein